MVVVGGGLAGIAAAVALAESGAAVTLLEGRPRLGGATSSFSRDGLAVDTGQHVFLRCCTAYRELLARLGVTGSVTLQDRFDVTVLSPAGQARLRASALPAPLHLAGALARYSLLPPADRLRAGRAVAAMTLARPGPALDAVPLGRWLAARGQREQARRRLWDLFVVSTLNVAGDEASTALAATVIKTGLLAARDAADIGVASVPLGVLHGEAALALLRRHGVQVRLGAKAEAVTDCPGGGFTVQAAGQQVPAAAVVVAVPAPAAADLLPAQAAAAGWDRITTAPIVNVHAVYDRRVTRLPFAAAVGSPVQWVFDKTMQSGLRSGQYLAVSLSAAGEYVDQPVARLRQVFEPALAELFPAARQAEMRDFFVTRERRATFRQQAGCGALRPGPATARPGLVLAGAWTDTGWPDTMEGAVRSGLIAVRQLTRDLAGVSA